MQESGQTGLAIIYLSTIVKQESNPALKKKYMARLNAFMEVRRIELAYEHFMNVRGAKPTTIEQLVNSGFLLPAPIDLMGAVLP
jgi:hypothetical protein